MLNFFDLLEKARVQGTLFNIEVNSINLLRDVDVKLMFFDKVNSKNKVLNIGPHYTDD